MDTNSTIKIFPLDKVQNLVAAATGLEVSHVFEDLVFIEHSAFLIQFDQEKNTRMNLYFNTDCSDFDSRKLSQSLHSAAQVEGVTLIPAGKFTMKQVPNKEEFTIHFS